MKIRYNTPEIKVEELTKADVLCASGDNTDPVIPPSPDNNGVTQTDWMALEKLL